MVTEKVNVGSIAADPEAARVYAAYEETRARLGIAAADQVLLVSISNQRMWQVANATQEVSACFMVSTGLRPPSCIEDSLGTPDGLHEIAEKYGNGLPPGQVLKGRIDTGQHFSAFPVAEQAKNLITSRILRLRGLERGRNAGAGCDSYDRYIYIHGTNQEGRLGSPASHGCVLMTNAEIIDLYPKVSVGTHVMIAG